MNVNQDNFPQFSPIATSLILELGKQQDCVDVKNQFLKNLTNRFTNYREGIKLDSEYQNALFLKDKLVTLQKGNERFKVVIRGVKSNGLLEVESNKKLEEFRENEVRFCF